MDIGHVTLENIEKMGNYNTWVFNKFLKYISGRVLEIGCGIGTITQYYIRDFDVTATDISQEYIDIVKQRFKNYQNFKANIFNIENKIDDVSDDNKYNTIICSNVLEHISDDFSTIANMHKLLRKNGFLVLLIPACPFLFSDLDKNVGHYRRYSMSGIKGKIEKAGFIVEEQFHINIFGAIGWFLSGKILRRKVLDNNLLFLYNFFAPLFIFAEAIFKIPFGLSIVNICRKTN